MECQTKVNSGQAEGLRGKIQAALDNHRSTANELMLLKEEHPETFAGVISERGQNKKSYSFEGIRQGSNLISFLICDIQS